MDPSRVAAEAHHLAERFVSLDPVQYDSAVNEYFDSNAVYEAKIMVLHGASQLKKYLHVVSYLAFDSHLVGRTHYNSHNQTAHFAFQRTFYFPTIPSVLPFSDNVNAWLKKKHIRSIFDSELHFNASQDGTDEPKLYVTKVGPTSRRGASFVEQLIPFFLLRPIVAFFVLALANVLGFFDRHSWNKDGPINLLLVSVAESWAWYRGAPLDAANYPRPIKQAQNLSDNLTKIVTDAMGTAQQAAHDVSTRAKDYGIPVHQGQHLLEFGIHLPSNAIHTASNITHSAFHTVHVIEHKSVGAVADFAHSAYNVTTGTAVNLAQGTVDQIEARAKGFGIPVDQYKDLAVKNARGAAEWFGLVKAKAEQQAGQARGTINDFASRGSLKISEAIIPTGTVYVSEPMVELGQPLDLGEPVHAEYDAVPRLPTGGHDPAAPNAPSYAQAAHE